MSRKNEIKIIKLELITKKLRYLMIEDEDSETARNISAAIVYLDCAKLNLANPEKYIIAPTIVATN